MGSKLKRLRRTVASEGAPLRCPGCGLLVIFETEQAHHEAPVCAAFIEAMAAEGAELTGGMSWNEAGELERFEL